MRALKTIIAEIVHLFVDDGSLAVAIVVWIAFVSLVLRRVEIARDWGGAILFAGLAAILIESALRGSRR